MLRIHCDAEGCGESIEAHLVRLARAEVMPLEREHKWTLTFRGDEHGRDAWTCPKHNGELPKLKRLT